MDTYERAEHAARRRHPTRYVLLALGVVVCVALAAAYLAGRRSLAGAVSRARALGPITLEELEAQRAARRTWPADQDAGPVFARIAQAMNEREKRMTPEEKEALGPVPLVGDADLPPLGHLWNEPDRAAANTHLERMAGLLAELDALRALPGGKLPLEIAEEPIMTLLPKLAPLRAAVKLESLAVLRAAADGPVTDLRERVEVMSRLHQLIEDQPTLISSLVAVAVDALLCDTLERTLAVDGVRAEDLQPLGDVLTARKPYVSLKWGLLGERAIFMEMGDRMRSGKLSGMQSIPYARVPVVNFVFLLDEAYGMGHYNRLIAAADDPRTLLATAKEVEQKMQNAPLWALFSKILVQSITRAVELAMQSEAQLRAARIGLAIERYRIEKGTFPEKPEDLVSAYLKELPVDPFDQQPMRYEPTSEGVVVYSVGIDRQDDGGQPHVRGRKTNYDTVFRVLAPEHRRRPPVAASEPAGE